MITIHELGNGKYRVSQHILSFTNTETTRWYWDVINRKISEKEDFPESLQTRNMTDEDIERFNQYYLPKAEKKNV